MTDERRAEISARISAALKGRPGVPRTPEWLEKLRLSNYNRTSLLRGYGISPDEYAAQRKLGFRWCHWMKHWVKSDQFGNKMAVCNECKPEYGRAMNLRKMFGLDQAWYESKLAEQGGVCALCGSQDPQNKGMRFFAIDHSHATNHIRGLLCTKCNQALERLDVIPGWAERAIAYVQRYRAAALVGSLPIAPKPFKRYVRPSKRKLKSYVPFRSGRKDDPSPERLDSVEDFEVAETLMKNPSGEIGVVTQ